MEIICLANIPRNATICVKKLRSLEKLDNGRLRLYVDERRDRVNANKKCSCNSLIYCTLTNFRNIFLKDFSPRSTVILRTNELRFIQNQITKEHFTDHVNFPLLALNNRTFASKLIGKSKQPLAFMDRRLKSAFIVIIVVNLSINGAYRFLLNAPTSVTLAFL